MVAAASAIGDRPLGPCGHMALVSSPRMSSHSLSDLTQQRDFMRLWTARLFGTTGGQMLMVAVGWQMYDLTGSAWDLGLVGLYQFVPALLFTLVAGHVADRVDRGRIVATCLLAQALVAGLLVAATQGVGAAGPWVSRELLLGVSVALGLARAFQMPAHQALTPMLLPAPLLARGLAFSSAGMQAAIMGGPALGGLLYGAGASVVYGACVAAFAVASVVVARLRYVRVARSAEPATLRTLLAGVSFVWQRKVILGAVSLDLFAVLLGGATALLPMFAKDILFTGPLGLGLLRGAPAAGALVMSVLLTRWPLRQRVGRTLLLAVALFGLCMVVFGLSTSFVVSLLALAVSGGADMVSVVVRQTLVQIETPDAMRGRVSAVNSVFIGASNQLGEFESGATAAWLGPVGSVVLGGIGTLLVAALWIRAFPTLARRDRLA
jgi:MFS family permease